MAKNDITGDSIMSRAPSKEYRDNWDRIFGKLEKEADKILEEHNIIPDDELPSFLRKQAD